jgi:predicted CoA-binding protein
MSANILTTDAAIGDLLRSVKRIAVLGIKTEAQAGQPSIEVPRFLVNAGFDVIPVPVYYPEATTILERPVYRKLADIPGEVDLIDVFRRPQDIPAHVEDVLVKRPRAVWFQSGIRHDAVAEQLAAAGILVVQDRCLMVELMGFNIRAS